MDELVVIREIEKVIVSAPGPQGPPGPPGPPGGGGYQHDQTVPASTWIINHNLGVYTSLTLIDPEGEIMHADVEWGSLNTTTVTFPGPQAGTAVFR